MLERAGLTHDTVAGRTMADQLGVTPLETVRGVEANPFPTCR